MDCPIKTWVHVDCPIMRTVNLPEFKQAAAGWLFSEEDVFRRDRVKVGTGSVLLKSIWTVRSKNGFTWTVRSPNIFATWDAELASSIVFIDRVKVGTGGSNPKT